MCLASLFQPFVFMKTVCVDYFGLGEAPEPFPSLNLARQGSRPVYVSDN